MLQHPARPYPASVPFLSSPMRGRLGFALLVLSASPLGAVDAAPAQAPRRPPAPTALQPGPDARARALQALVDSAHRAGRFDGAVLVWTGRDAAGATAGMADPATGRRWTLDTRSPWCSVSKLVTAVVVLNLAREGRLRLSDAAGRHVPALASGPTVTLRQLLTHTSGLATDGGTAAFWSRPAADVRRSANALLAGPRRDAPGASFRYDNLDYLALEQVVEAVEGRPFADVVARRVSRPLGLHTLALGRGVESVGRTVDSVGTARPAPVYTLDAFGAAGGLVGSVRDLLAFGRALSDGRLLPRPWLDALATVPPNGQSGLSVWTYPVATADGRRVRVLERQGWIGGHRALLVAVPETGAVVAVLASTDAADLARTSSGAGLSADLLRLALAR